MGLGEEGPGSGQIGKHSCLTAIRMCAETQPGSGFILTSFPLS